MLSDTSRQQDFPGLAEMTYLNTAAEGIPPLVVGEALKQYFLDKQLGMDGRDKHAVQWEEAKRLVASMYGLTADEVTICSNSSEAFNLAAMAFERPWRVSPSIHTCRTPWALIKAPLVSVSPPPSRITSPSPAGR